MAKNGVILPTYYELFGVTPHVDARQLHKCWIDVEKKIGNNKKKRDLGEKVYNFLKDESKREWYGVMTGLDDLRLPDTCGSAYNVSQDTLNDNNIKKFIKLHDKHKRSEDRITNIFITLEDVYTGKTISVGINRLLPCQSCPNSLGKIDASCPACATLPPWRAQQMCAVCGNTKKILKNCERCGGKGTTKERQKVDVDVKKGAHNGLKIRAKGVGNRRKVSKNPEDLLFRVHQYPHKTFMRQGYNLFVSKILQLSDVLCRKPFVIEHLNGRKLKVCHGDVNITPGCTLVIKNEGLPILDGDDNDKGDLIVSFDIKFPTKFSLDEIKILKKILPSPTQVQQQDTDMEKHPLKSVDLMEYSDRRIPAVFDEKYPGHRMYPRKDPGNSCNVQ